MVARSAPLCLATSLLFLLCACRPLYIPPVPAPLELPERLEVDAGGVVDAGTPRLEVELVNVVEPVWLAAQWFSPANDEVASESVWVTQADEGTVLTLLLPADVKVVPGRWRAVLSASGRVLRQVSIEVP